MSDAMQVAKPLEWVDTHYEVETISKTTTPWGDYAITSWSTGDWRTMYGVSKNWDLKGSKDELQAAAQADYEQRTRSALSDAALAAIDAYPRAIAVRRSRQHRRLGDGPC